MQIEAEIRAKLDSVEIFPAENIGQHLLVDQGVIDSVVSHIEQGSNVLEIGAGPGNLTEKIAEKTKKVVAVEIDQRFEPLLSSLQEKYPNVEIVYKDAISLNFEKIIKTKSRQRDWQVVSNLPFHISEPFIYKLIDIPIDNAVLIVGDQLARKIQIDDPECLEFSRLSLLTQTFFEVNVISLVRKDSFYPQPRTDAVMLTLTPREKVEFERSRGKAILRSLFLTEKKNPSVLSVIKDSRKMEIDFSLMSKTESHRYDRRQIKRELKEMTNGLQFGYTQVNSPKLGGNKEIEKLGLSNELLNKPFSRFDNQDIRTLAIALRSRYGQF